MGVDGDDHPSSASAGAGVWSVQPSPSHERETHELNGNGLSVAVISYDVDSRRTHVMASVGLPNDDAFQSSLQRAASEAALAGKPKLETNAGAPNGVYLPAGASRGDIVIYIGRSPIAAPSHGVERYPSPTPTPLDAVFGQCEGMLRFKQQAAEAAKSGVNVLLLGPTGVGKQVSARAMHEASGRKGPFKELDCTLLESERAESEIFGHVRGAYTGATTDRKGAFEAADTGTLFLDEIGELPLSIQAKFLKVLDEPKILRMGAPASDKPKLVDVWVIAATNRDLFQMVERGTFKKDLYFRLASKVLRLPPLQERGADVIGLARHLLLQLSEERGCRPLGLTSDAEAAILAYPWPGNVRELRHCLRNAVIARDQQWIDVEHLDLHTHQRVTSNHAEGHALGRGATTEVPPSSQSREKGQPVIEERTPALSLGQIKDFLSCFVRNWPRQRKAKGLMEKRIVQSVLLTMGAHTGKPGRWVEHVRRLDALKGVPHCLKKCRLSLEEAEAFAAEIVMKAGDRTGRDAMAEAAAALLGAGDKAPQLLRAALGDSVHKVPTRGRRQSVRNPGIKGGTT